MEEGRMLKHQIGYEKLLRAVGRFCDDQKMDEVCLLEFEKGMVLQGLQVSSTGEGYIRHLVSYTWSYEQIAQLAKGGKLPPAEPQPAGQGGKR
jgi:hypothetical protein